MAITIAQTSFPTTQAINPSSSHSVSVNMNAMYESATQDDGVTSLDMDMVADFGDDDEMRFGGDDTVAHLSDAHPSSVDGTGIEPVNVDDMFKAETGLDGGSDDDDDSPAPTKRRRETQDVPGGFTYVDKDGESGRRKIRIEYITDKSRRHITFSKRKAGIMKKAYELSILTGTQVLLLVVSETGLVYTFTTTKLQPLVQNAEGRNLIQACLNAPDGLGPDGQPSGGPIPATKGKNGGLAIRPHKLTAAASAAMAATAAQAAGNDTSAAAHARAQSSAAAALGQGQPGGQAVNGSPAPGSNGTAARPKKRMPSSAAKKRSASQAAANNSANGVHRPDLAHPQQPDMIPPVPPIPDMHRQPSPNSAHLLSGHPQSLQSPLGGQSQGHGGYHLPPGAEYHQPHHGGGQHPQHGIPSPTYGYPQPGGPGGDYGGGSGMGIPTGYGGYGQHPGGGYMVHPAMYQQQGGGAGDRRMMQGM